MSRKTCFARRSCISTPNVDAKLFLPGQRSTNTPARDAPYADVDSAGWLASDVPAVWSARAAGANANNAAPAPRTQITFFMGTPPPRKKDSARIAEGRGYGA